MSCAGKDSKTWSKNMPAEVAIPVIAGLWAKRIKKIETNVTDQGVAMQPGQQTACVLAFGTPTQYAGSSNSGYHAEVDALNKANTAGETLSNATFPQLTNACCLVCATALFAVGVTSLPAMADSKKEYANYRLPEFFFDDEAQGGVLHRLLGTDAWTAWTSHLSPATRSRKDQRQALVTKMTQSL
jgi:tRNA(Arg) A34 adenosine deaminase TadA